MSGPDLPGWQRLVKENKFYFKKNPRLKYDSVERIGYHGGSIIFNEHNSKGRIKRKITVRFATTRRGLELLENEILCLQHLSGSEHIARVIKISDSRLNISGTGRNKDHPILATEYLPYGSLKGLRERAARARRWIPNTILWSVFLCLARQNLACMFPLRANPDAPQRREAVGTQLGNALGIIEPNNLHDGISHRFRFSEPAEDTEEHGSAPAVVATDFSRGRLSESYDDTAYHNLHAIGAFMARFALNLDDEQGINFLTQRWLLSNGQLIRMFPEHAIVQEEVRTVVPPRLMHMPGIDFQLKEIIARCLAVEVDNMLNYRNLVILCQDGLEFSSPVQINNMPSSRQEELTIGGDRRFVQDFIYNADIQAESSILGEQNRFGEWV
ncbi:hypothetical protein F5B19DRAFT_462976 [Rostrohypoxylon terebratum]|nr:hypothetical protein F5B19DRAFT_462976 [Rostrohypoxylon terebratum]